MKKFTISIFAFAAFLGGTLLGQNQARDITGTWQGTLHAGTDLRTVLKISKADGGALKAVFYSIDQGGQAIPVSSISVQGSTVKFAVAAIGGNYEGKLSNTDGTTITGTWTQGPNPLALELTLAELQGRDDCLVCASGVGAIAQTLLALTRQGDHVLCFLESYGPTRFLIRRTLARFGVSHTLL